MGSTNPLFCVYHNQIFFLHTAPLCLQKHKKNAIFLWNIGNIMGTICFGYIKKHVSPTKYINFIHTAFLFINR